jgi:hypothetical protein
MRPPDLTERASLGLFSGLGELDEHFTAAYLRFNKDLVAELKPFTRESDEGAVFVAGTQSLATELAQMDALRLLESYNESPELAAEDSFLHARLATRLDTLDVYYDSLAEDQFKIARLTSKGTEDFFDVWMAFPGRAARGLGEERVTDPAVSAAAVAVEDFQIEAELHPPETLEAVARLQLNVRQGGQRLLLFQLSRSLRVSSVTADGTPVEFLQNEALGGSALARLGNDLLTVVMPAALRAGEQHKMEVRYAGAVMRQAAPGLLAVGERGTWYPNRGMQMSHFELDFRWPRPWTLVATGRPAPQPPQGEMQAGRWVAEQRIPLAGFNLGRFQRAVVESGGAEVASYSAGVFEQPLEPAASERLLNEAVARNQAVAAQAARAVESYRRWFGPYPYGELSLTQLPGRLSQGWPTLVYLSSLVYLSDEQRAGLQQSEFARLITGEFMLDHEVAHQWWGDRVGWRGYRDQWLMEALANLSALMLLEQRSPAQARELLQQYRHQLLAPNAAGRRYAEAGPVTLGYRLSSSVFPDAYVPVTYGRGLWLLVMLRDYFRDAEAAGDGVTAPPAPAGQRPAGKTKSSEGEAFLRALREFGRRYDGRTATTDDFRRTLEEFLPPGAPKYEGRGGLQWFFDEWVRGSAVPSIELKRLALRSHGAATTAAFDLEQQQCPESTITSVPIYAELAGGRRILLRRVFADGLQSHFELNVPEGTRRLLADPDHRLLRSN